MTPKQVFVREATGLVKSIGPWTIMLAVMSEIAFGSGILLMNVADSYLPSGNPGGNVVVAAGLFMIVVMLEAYIYYIMIPAYGRSGSDYVWMSRNIGPVPAGLLGFSMVLTGFPYVAMVLNQIFTLALIPSISTIGLLTGNASVSSLATGLWSPVFLTLASLVILVVVTAVDIVWPRGSFMLLGVCTAIAIIGTLVAGIVFAVVGPSGIQASLASFLAENNASYTDIASQYTGPWVSMPSVILLFPFLGFFFNWINNAGVFGGEMKHLRRSAFTGTLLACAVSGGFLILFLQMYYSYVGFNFAMQAPLSWPSSLAAAGLTPNMLTIATIAIRGNAALMWIMNLCFVFWYVAAVQQTILNISRYLFAFSFDRLLPGRLAAVSDRFHSPFASILATFIICVPMIILVSFTNWLYLFSTTAAGTLFFTFIGLTAIVYGWKRRETLKNTSTWLIISGVIVGAFFLYMTYMILALPYYGINALSWGVMLFVWIAGALAYPISKIYHGRKGIDVSMIFKELPPE
jgi:amino acid transporter